MKEHKIEQYRKHYQAYMEEIKRRTELAQKVFLSQQSGEGFTGNLDTDLDLIYLQIRKVCELIMYAVVASNLAAGRELNKELKRSAYEPKKIKRLLEQKTDVCSFPKSIIRTKSGDLTHITDTSNAEDILNIGDLIEAWSLSGEYLHAKRVHQANVNKKKSDLDTAIEFFNKQVGLLNEHIIIVNDDHQFAVIMQEKESQSVKVVVLKKVA
ncbi:hypothetical protein [Vibrio vulnificus]|uniref:hypothetical protein n=1 Tax=Vibrio vulnificus TaxID=672 RepID=UPI000C7B289C|nr:hypothetical protein [Vibrio vulnificus]AUJ35338.1 hypothetical protein BWZ32_11080 [Vibrio vulnificus]HAS6159251.1 hypothetical protein [Vibrio vulnificus]